MIKPLFAYPLSVNNKTPLVIFSCQRTAALIFQVVLFNGQKEGLYLAEDLKSKVAKLISKENKKNPLTDEQIAQKLSVLRETITGIRKDLNIQSSRDRKRKIIQNVIETIKINNPDITISSLTAKIENEGFKVSRSYIADMMNQSSLDDHNKQPTIEMGHETGTFSRLIGYEGSLSKNIKQGQAAILYPPFGLPTLIVGESGTGKTLFAEYMYNYAIQKKVIKENAPFVSFNCADYSDNPQLLVSILYGYKKGTFTGADQDTEGLVERANNGMLFLDEIHRLPPKGQEMLFSILDKGKFRRMGEVDAAREAHIYFIGATTENIESSLLLTFRRRIPMIIELPALEERSLQEKVQLIYGFFQEEANRTNYRILVNAKIMAAFAFKKYLGNIGQLKSEVQVTCANAYVDKINNNRDEINIGFNEILYQNLFYDINISKITMTFKDSLFIPNIIDKKDAFITAKTHYSLPEDIYEKIENKYYELKELHIPSVEIEKIIWDFLLNYFETLGLDSSNKHLTSLDELKYLVNNKIIQLLKNFIKKIKDQYPNSKINEKVVIYLAIHLSEAIKRIKFKQDILNPNLIYIKENFTNEFEFASDLARNLEQEENIEIPEGETGFIAMYINELLKIQNDKSRIAIITIFHGKIASELISVVNKMMNVDFPIAVDMPLDVNPVKIFEQVIEISKSLETKKGILFFVDMGSLVNIGEIVYARTGIKTRTIDRVDLVSVLEAVRKVDISEESLDDIYYDIINSKHNYSLITTDDSGKPPALITMCLTGHGVALKIKDILSVYYTNMKIIPLSILDDNVKLKISHIKQQYNVPAIIGTINPRIEAINFIPFEDNFTKDKRMFLDYLLKQNNYSGLSKMIKEDFILLDLECKTKKEIIETMGMILFNKGLIKIEYIHSVFNREDMNSTCFRNNIAIPHGYPSFVNESAIVFARLKQCIDWDKNGNKVNLVCLPAIKSEDVNIINDLFGILKQKNKIDKLLQVEQCFEFINIICQINTVPD